MRMSCNGCRVLRKGCSEDCNIRPCLQWIQSPESQANATLFLSKFYGRVGLNNLINASPQHLRPELFRSLLYEACGRILNPIYGSVGLLWSGSWQLCDAAVEAVLKGVPITPINFDPMPNMWVPPPNIYDMRHVSQDESSIVPNGAKRVKTRSGSKQVVSSVIKPKPSKRIGYGLGGEENQSASHHSSSSPRFEMVMEGERNKESGSAVYAEASIHNDDPESNSKASDHQARESGDEVRLELKLGFEPTSRAEYDIPMKKRKIDLKNWPC